MRGCDDQFCCPEPRKLSKEERKLNKRLAFIEEVAEANYLSGNTLIKVYLPKALGIFSKPIYEKSIYIYETSYGPVEIVEIEEHDGPPRFVHKRGTGR